MLLVAVLAAACTKNDVTTTGGNNGNNNGGGNNGGGSDNTPAMIIKFENSSYNGAAVVAYTDGSSISANFQNGILRLPLSATKDKTIKSLTPQNQGLLLIGRIEGDSIILNYNNGVLNFRSAVREYIPIGSYAEFQLINTKRPLTGQRNFELKYDLDLMNEEWAGIGYGSPDGFDGIFEGGGHVLKNLKQTASNNSAGGLFGRLDGTRSSVEIRNLTISSGSIVSKSRSAGAFAMSAIGGVSFRGCQNYASVAAGGDAAYAGGIVGEIGGLGNANGTFYFKNVTNHAEISITTAGGTVGGIAGGALFDAGCIIDTCTNNGTVRGGQRAGGIIGGMTDGNTYFSISNSVNKGNIIATATAGGIVGYGSASVYRSRNSGTITCSNSDEVGGIAGRCATVGNSYNEGAISATIPEGNNSPVIGGVAGHVAGSVIGNFNTGNITVNINRTYDNNNTVGGVIGSFSTTAPFYISYCYNKGTITVTGNSTYRIIGGVIGTAYPNQSVDYCFNAAPVYCSAGFVGGLAGFAANGNPNNTSVFRCYWLDNPSDHAVYGVGNWKGTLPPGTDLKKFGATAWPSAAENWTIGNGTNNANWKSLGSWNNGNPVYPKLFYEE